MKRYSFHEVSFLIAYPGPVIVNYETNRVTRSGAANVLITKE